MELVNDARLRELAREPVRELFLVARRDAAIRPLVMLLVVLPGLMVFWSPSLDESTCQQGLRALDVGAKRSVGEWLATASNEPSTSYSSAKPLTLLLTALGLKVKLLSPESRLMLTSYVSIVFLLLCLGGFAKKLGGMRFAMLVVLLACGHREFLALNRGLPPIAFPLAFAVLSIRGMLSHQACDGSWISWPLLGSGMALAACSLAGGELAVGAWCILGVLSAAGCCDVAHASVRAPSRRWILRFLTHLAVNGFGVLFVTAVGFIVVSTWQFAFSDGLEFRDAVGGGLTVWGMWREESRWEWTGQSVWENTGFWLGFVLLGAMRIARAGQPEREEAGTQSRRFLIGWLCVAGAVTSLAWTMHGVDFKNSAGWSSFLLLSLLFLAALGLESVLLRAIGLASVVTAVFVTIGVHSLPFWLSRLPNAFNLQSLVLGFMVVSVAAWACVWLFGRVAGTEPRRRVALVGCVTLLIVLDIADGFLSRPPLADDERELLAFRRQLVQDDSPKTCWLVTDEPSPARLRFFLRSLWSDVDVIEAKREGLVSVDLWTRPAAGSEPSAFHSESTESFAIVVTWGSSRLPVEEWRRRGLMLTQSAAPHFFQGRPLKAYRWTLRPSSGPSAKP